MFVGEFLGTYDFLLSVAALCRCLLPMLFISPGMFPLGPIPEVAVTSESWPHF